MLAFAEASVTWIDRPAFGAGTGIWIGRQVSAEASETWIGRQVCAEASETWIDKQAFGEASEIWIDRQVCEARATWIGWRACGAKETASEGRATLSELDEEPRACWHHCRGCHLTLQGQIVQAGWGWAAAAPRQAGQQ